jgi:hypothetical protein
MHSKRCQRKDNGVSCVHSCRASLQGNDYADRLFHKEALGLANILEDLDKGFSLDCTNVISARATIRMMRMHQSVNMLSLSDDSWPANL